MKKRGGRKKKKKKKKKGGIIRGKRGEDRGRGLGGGRG